MPISEVQIREFAYRLENTGSRHRHAPGLGVEVDRELIAERETRRRVID